MISLLIALSLSSKYSVTETGSYYGTFTSSSLQLTFNIPFYSSYSNYILISNLPTDLMLNGQKATSSVYRISSKTFLFESTIASTLYFDVVMVPDSCNTLEFLFNPMNSVYDYPTSSKPLDTQKLYCLVAYNPNEFKVSFSNTEGTMKYHKFSLYDGFSVDNGQSLVYTSTTSFVVQFRPTNSDTSKAKITFSYLSYSSDSEVLVYDSSKSSYFASTSVDTTAANTSYLDYGIYSESYQSSNTDYNISTGTYVVFTKWNNIAATAKVGSTQLNILDNTDIVAIFFNQTGTLTIRSNSSSLGSATFITYNMPDSCHYIVTLSGSESYKFNRKGRYNKCMVSAFTSGQVSTETGTFGTIQNYDYSGSSLSSYSTATSPMYSVFYNTFSSDNEYFKHTITTYSNDDSNNYIIQGNSPEYSSYWISRNSHDKLNSGEWSSKGGLAGWAVALIVIFVLIVIVVVIVVVCIVFCACCSAVDRALTSSSSSSSSSNKKHVPTTTTTTTIYIQQQPSAYPPPQQYPQQYPQQQYPQQQYPPQQYPPQGQAQPQPQPQPYGYYPPPQQYPPPPPSEPNPYV